MTPKCFSKKQTRHALLFKNSQIPAPAFFPHLHSPDWLFWGRPDSHRLTVRLHWHVWKHRFNAVHKQEAHTPLMQHVQHHGWQAFACFRTLIKLFWFFSIPGFCHSFIHIFLLCFAFSLYIFALPFTFLLETRNRGAATASRPPPVLGPGPGSEDGPNPHPNPSERHWATVVAIWSFVGSATAYFVKWSVITKMSLVFLRSGSRTNVWTCQVLFSSSCTVHMSWFCSLHPLHLDNKPLNWQGQEFCQSQDVPHPHEARNKRRTEKTWEP